MMKSAYAILSHLAGLGLLFQSIGFCNHANSHSPTTLLFLDNAHIARQENIERVFETPAKHPANPLIVQEHPWEARYVQVYGNAIYDPEWNKFRMWYSASASEDADPEMTICYAESDNGIHWIKPMVGTADVPQYKEHNIVINGGHGFCVLRDEHETDPQKRYKGLGGDIIGHSPDGLNWTIEQFDESQQNDTSSSLVYWQGNYWAFYRNQAYRNDRIRAHIRKHKHRMDLIREVAASTSGDFQDWSPKRTVFTTYHPDDEYPMTQPYGMAVIPYENMLLGWTWWIDLDPELHDIRMGDQYTNLAVSHNGLDWSMVQSQEPFLRPSPGTWDGGGRLSPAASVVAHDGLMYFYYAACDARHGDPFQNMGIGLATLSENRFAALRKSNPSEPSFIETKPLMLESASLLVNYDGPASGLRAELLDESKAILPGFERENSSLEKIDALHYRLSWKNNDAATQPASIKIHINEGKLYTLECASTQSAQRPQSHEIWDAWLEEKTLEDALEFVGKGQDSAALDIVNHRLQTAPADPMLHACRALIHARLKQNGLAEQDAEHTLRLNIQDPEVFYALGIASLELGLEDEAAVAFDLAVQKAPRNHRYLSERGLAYYLSDLYEPALRDVNLALQINADDIFSLDTRANIYFETREYQKGLRDNDRILLLDRDSIQAYKGKAYCELSLNQYDQAIQNLLIVLEYDKPVYAYFLACAYNLRSAKMPDSPSRNADIEKALSYVELAIQGDSVDQDYLLVDPNLEALREDPRFAQLVQRKN